MPRVEHLAYDCAPSRQEMAHNYAQQLQEDRGIITVGASEITVLSDQSAGRVLRSKLNGGELLLEGSETLNGNILEQLRGGRMVHRSSVSIILSTGRQRNTTNKALKRLLALTRLLLNHGTFKIEAPRALNYRGTKRLLPTQQSKTFKHKTLRAAASPYSFRLGPSGRCTRAAPKLRSCLGRT